MRCLMRQHAGQFVGGFHQIDQVIGDDNPATRQGEGVGETRIDHTQFQLEGRIRHVLQALTQLIQ